MMMMMIDDDVVMLVVETVFFDIFFIIRTFFGFISNHPNFIDILRTMNFFFVNGKNSLFESSVVNLRKKILKHLKCFG